MKHNFYRYCLLIYIILLLCTYSTSKSEKIILTLQCQGLLCLPISSFFTYILYINYHKIKSVFDNISWTLSLLARNVSYIGSTLVVYISLLLNLMRFIKMNTCSFYTWCITVSTFMIFFFDYSTKCFFIYIMEAVLGKAFSVFGNFFFNLYK